MKILITGGKGFIGSHLADALRNNHEVVVIDDLSGGFEKDNDEFWEADCRDAKDMDRIFTLESPDVVYHLAANAAENKAQFSPIDITSRNYSAFINTLTPFIKYGGKKFVFTSSIAVYGALQTPFKETDRPEPEDLYGVTKLAAERTLEIMSKVHGFEYAIVRPHNVYGPRQNMSDPYRNVVTIWMNALLREKPCYIYGDGKQKRQFTYIDDITKHLVDLSTSTEERKILNVGSNTVSTLNSLYRALQEVTGMEEEPIYLSDRPQEVKDAIADNSLICETPLLDGLRKTWTWCQIMGPQEPIYTDIEIPNKKIPSNWL